MDIFRRRRIRNNRVPLVRALVANGHRAGPDPVSRTVAKSSPRRAKPRAGESAASRWSAVTNRGAFSSLK